jgi:uncharacterized DUF497 family protein
MALHLVFVPPERYPHDVGKNHFFDATLDAVSALEDEGALTRPDPDARDEQRFVSLGMDAEGRVLVTVFSMRAETVRVISARKASPGERRRYGAD